MNLVALIYRQNPGLYSDVIFTHILHFNIDLDDKLEPFVNPKKRAADIRFFRDCLTRFHSPADELCPFFEVVNNRSFAFSVLYDHMIRTHDFSLEDVKTCLPDVQTMMQKLRDFYLPEHTDCDFSSLQTIKNCIQKMPVSPSVKFHLLALMIDSKPYYDALFLSLEKRETEMRVYYEESCTQLDEIKKSIKLNDVYEYLDKCHGVTRLDLPNDMTFSFMLVGKNAVRFVAGDKPFIILGADYPARLAMLIGEAVQPDIVKIGKALSEEKRVMILQLLLAEKEITAQQLLRRLELSMTATHYHLEMLMQAGMLLSRNEGRTIYYSLNREFFDRAPIVFDKFNSKEEF